MELPHPAPKEKANFALVAKLAQNELNPADLAALLYAEHRVDAQP